MPNAYARQTALRNAGGRVDYITNPERQERLLGVYDAAGQRLQGYWEHQARECQAAHKHARAGTKVVEGRELVIQLSNSLLDRMEPAQICRVLAEDFERQYGRPATVALHWNKKKSNLHAHLIYSERELLAEPVYKVAKRDMYMDAEDRRHYKKAEILDAAGELRPGCYIIPAGAGYETHFFGPRDARFSRPEWLRDCKANWILPLRNGALRGDVEIGLFDYSTGKLPLQHVGTLNNVDAATAREIRAAVEQYNDLVRKYNRLVDAGKIKPAEAKRIQQTVLQAPQRNRILAQQLARAAVLTETRRRAELLIERGQMSQQGREGVEALISQGKLPVLWINADKKLCCTRFDSPEKAVALAAKTAAPFRAPAPAPERPPEPAPLAQQIAGATQRADEINAAGRAAGPGQGKFTTAELQDMIRDVRRSKTVPTGASAPADPLDPAAHRARRRDRGRER